MKKVIKIERILPEGLKMLKNFLEY